MANRAYLYASDRSDDWDHGEKEYYDSRWAIPLAWFFLYEPADVRLIDVYRQGSHWQEAKLWAEKATAVARFVRRGRMLLSLIGGRLPKEAVGEFVAKVEERPGRNLLMDPAEVLGGGGGTEAEHAANFVRILSAIGDGDAHGETVRALAQFYVGEFDADPARFECQILGVTYW